MSGVKESHKDEQYHSLPFSALREVAKVYKYGSVKYGPYNYLDGYNYSLSIDALCRHLFAWLDPEDSDIDESGYDHMAHVAWHALNLLYMNLSPAGKVYDDRQATELAYSLGKYEASGFHQADKREDYYKNMLDAREAEAGDERYDE